MFVKNESKRLIDFSWNKKKYRLMPAGKAVEVPNEAKKSTFLGALIKSNDVSIVAELTEEEKAEINLENIRRDATSLGIQFDEEWSAKDLTSEIELVELRNKATDLKIEFKEDWDAKKLTSEIKKKEK